MKKTYSRPSMEVVFMQQTMSMLQDSVKTGDSYKEGDPTLSKRRGIFDKEEASEANGIW